MSLPSSLKTNLATALVYFIKVLELRSLKVQDFKDVLELVAGFPLTKGFSWPSEKLEQELKEAQAVGLWEDDKLKAFVVYRENVEAFEINLLGTDVRSRRGGQMKRLLNELINANSQKDWWLEVHEENQAALGLYEQLGFQVTGRRPRYYSDGKTALLMTLKKNS